MTFTRSRRFPLALRSPLISAAGMLAIFVGPSPVPAQTGAPALSAHASLTPYADAQPLSPAGADNLAAFARLYGAVRWFCPADESKELNWDSFAVLACERLESPADANALASALGELFTPIAPGVQIWAGGPDAAPAPIAPPAPDVLVGHVSWRHRGLGVQRPGGYQIYTDELLTLKPADPLDPKLTPARGTIKTLDLGAVGGVRVTARVPISVATTPAGTWPRADAGKATDLVNAAQAKAIDPDARATRLASAIIAWNVFQNFYPYFDDVPDSGIKTCPASTETGPFLIGALKQAAEAKDRLAFRLALSWLVAQYHDGHGYVQAQGLAPSLALPLLWTWADDGTGTAAALVVTTVKNDAEGQLARGDTVLEIDGTSVADWYARVRPYISAGTEAQARFRACSALRLATCDDKDHVTLKVRKLDGTIVTATVTPAELIPPPDPTTNVWENRPKNGTEIAPGVLYVNMHLIKAEEIDRLMPKLVKAKGLVLDARGYPDSGGTTMIQHLAASDVQSAKWKVPIFLEPGGIPIGYDESGRWTLPPLKPRLGADGQKVVYITDGRAVSYAESCLGIVEAYKLAPTVGEVTAGTNGNVNPVALPGGMSFVWTGMKVIKHDDSRHHGVGIPPTTPVVRTAKGIAEERDELIEKAIELVSPK